MKNMTSTSFHKIRRMKDLSLIKDNNSTTINIDTSRYFIIFIIINYQNRWIYETKNT